MHSCLGFDFAFWIFLGDCGFAAIFTPACHICVVVAKWDLILKVMKLILFALRGFSHSVTNGLQDGDPTTRRSGRAASGSSQEGNVLLIFKQFHLVAGARFPIDSQSLQGSCRPWWGHQLLPPRAQSTKLCVWNCATRSLHKDEQCRAHCRQAQGWKGGTASLLTWCFGTGICLLASEPCSM